MSGPKVTVGTASLAPLKKPEPPPPAPFKIDSSTKLEDWKKWQTSFRLYAHATHLYQKSHDVQLSTFKSMLGPDGMEIYNNFSILDITDVESVMQKFDEHFKPKVNVTLERYKLYKLYQKSGQTFDDYLADITNQVDKCGFNSLRDEIVLYKIVGGINSDEIRNALLADADLKFGKALQICRGSSATHFMSGKKNPQKMKKAELANAVGVVLTETAYKDQKESSGTEKTSTQKAAGSQVLATGDSKREEAAVSGATAGPCKEEFLIEYVKLSPSWSAEKETEDSARQESGSSDDGDDWRGIDDHYAIVVESESDLVDPLETSGDMDLDERESIWEEHVTDMKQGKLLQKNLRQRLYSTSDKRLHCDMCDKTFRVESTLDIHRKTHLPPEPTYLTCYHCGRVCRKRALRKHMNVAHSGILGLPGPEMFACDVCNFTTRFRANLERHKFQHTGEKPLSCDYCDYTCRTARLLRAHVAKLHTGERPFACSVCNRGFLHSDAVKRHMVVHLPQTERTKTKQQIQIRYACEQCGNDFASKSSLQAHLLRHTGERTYACPLCEFRTVTSGGLSSHLFFKHNDDKPFVCAVCGFSCKQRQGLTRHMMMHADEKPFACEVCGRRFLQSAHVKRHMSVHTGEKPHVCEICGQRWAQKANLRAHMNVHLRRSGDPSLYTPPRKRQKKVVTIVVKSDESDSEPTPADAIIQWSEQDTASSSIEYSPNMETPQALRSTYTVHQENPRPGSSRDSIGSGNVRARVATNVVKKLPAWRSDGRNFVSKD